jgi:hypothetical protein
MESFDQDTNPFAADLSQGDLEERLKQSEFENQRRRERENQLLAEYEEIQEQQRQQLEVIMNLQVIFASPWLTL